MKIILWIWQLPQNILGCLLWFWERVIRQKKLKIEKRDNVIIFIMPTSQYGVCLGNFIFVNENWVNKDPRIIDHEYGHSIQSKKWGPLYLLVVGIPSAWRNIQSRKRKVGKFYMEQLEVSKWYYSGWPEKQADELGGVKRSFEIY